MRVHGRFRPRAVEPWNRSRREDPHDGQDHHRRRSQGSFREQRDNDYYEEGDHPCDRRWHGEDERDFRDGRDYERTARGFYTNDPPSANSAVVETVFRKPKVYADLHEYDDGAPMIDRVPTAIGYHSMDSAEEYAEEKSRASRYSYDLRDEVGSQEPSEEARPPPIDQVPSPDHDDKYAQYLQDTQGHPHSTTRSMWSQDSDSCPPVWRSFSEENEEHGAEWLLKQARHRAALNSVNPLNPTSSAGSNTQSELKETKPLSEKVEEGSMRDKSHETLSLNEGTGHKVHENFSLTESTEHRSRKSSVQNKSKASSSRKLSKKGWEAWGYLFSAGGESVKSKKSGDSSHERGSKSTKSRGSKSNGSKSTHGTTSKKSQSQKGSTTDVKQANRIDKKDNTRAKDSRRTSMSGEKSMKTNISKIHSKQQPRESSKSRPQEPNLPQMARKREQTEQDFSTIPTKTTAEDETKTSASASASAKSSTPGPPITSINLPQKGPLNREQTEQDFSTIVTKTTAEDERKISAAGKSTSSGPPITSIILPQKAPLKQPTEAIPQKAPLKQPAEAVTQKAPLKQPSEPVDIDAFIMQVRGEEETPTQAAPSPQMNKTEPKNPNGFDGFISAVMNGFANLANLGLNEPLSFLDWSGEEKEIEKLAKVASTGSRHKDRKPLRLDEEKVLIVERSVNSKSSKDSGKRSVDSRQRENVEDVSVYEQRRSGLGENDSRVGSIKKKNGDSQYGRDIRDAHRETQQGRHRQEHNYQLPPTIPQQHRQRDVYLQATKPVNSSISQLVRNDQAKGGSSRHSQDKEVQSLNLDGQGDNLESRVPLLASEPAKAEPSLESTVRDIISISSIEFPTPDFVLQEEDDGSVSILGLDRRHKHNKASQHVLRSHPEAAIDETRQDDAIIDASVSKSSKKSFIGRFRIRKKAQT